MDDLRVEIAEILRQYLTGYMTIHDCTDEIMQAVEKKFGDDLK